jgi:hypothetical protein
VRCGRLATLLLGVPQHVRMCHVLRVLGFISQGEGGAAAEKDAGNIPKRIRYWILKIDVDDDAGTARVRRHLRSSMIH